MSSAEPVTNPVWRGSFKASNGFGRVDGVVAHLSTKAASEVLTAASLLPLSLTLDFLPTPDVWQRCFGSSVPTGDKIDLYFVPENESYQSDYYVLLDRMYRNDLAARTEVENGVLFLFTSPLLPSDYRRLNRKHYLWGVLVEKKVEQMDGLCQQDGSCQDFASSNSIAADGSFGGDERVTSPTKAPDGRRSYEEESSDAPFLELVKAIGEREESADTNSTIRVSVGAYTVDASLGQTLQAIFNRYGDIAQDCPIKSKSARARFLEELGRGLKDLEEVEFVGCSRRHLKSLHTAVTNAEGVGLNVAWLRQRYDELAATYMGVKDYTTLKRDVDKSVVVAEFGKKGLNSAKAGLVEMESKMEAVRGQLACLQTENKVLGNETSRCCGKASKFLKKSLDDGLI